jgi:hypothetical protein
MGEGIHYIFNHVSIMETPTLHEGKITSRNVLFDYTTKSANVFPSLRNVVSSGHHDLVCLFVCLVFVLLGGKKWIFFMVGEFYLCGHQFGVCTSKAFVIH